MNTQKYCGKIEVYSLVLTDLMNINSLTVLNSKYFTSIFSKCNLNIPILCTKQNCICNQRKTSKTLYIYAQHLFNIVQIIVVSSYS